MKTANHRRPPRTVGFRLDEAALGELARRATQLGVSPHALARHYVLEQLRAAEIRTEGYDTVAKLQAEMGALRADWALAVEALLVSAGQVSAAEARVWIEENFPAPLC
jgi:hypothetical protein